MHILTHPTPRHVAARATWDPTTHGARTSRAATLRNAAGWIALGALAALLVILRPIGLGGTTALVLVSGDSMRPAIASGDVAVVFRTGDYAPGDVIAYRPAAAPDGRIIHRVIGGDAAAGFITRGDARTSADPDRPLSATIDGEVVAVLPGIGPVVGLLRDPRSFAALGSLLLVSVVAGALGRRRRGV